MSTRSNRLRPVRLNRRPVAESTTAHQGERAGIVETPRILTEATGVKPGRLLVQLIKAGWSLNGRYYPAEVLKRDGPRAFPAGTLNYVDHATDAEDEDRPAGSLLKLASYQTEDAHWDEARQALVAPVRLFAPWREAVTDWAESGAVGMSIRAWVYGEEGKREGREGWIVTEFDSGRSVDYVTVPAAGGAMLQILESVQAGATVAPQVLAEARSVGVWLESRLHLALTQLGDDMYGNGRLTRPERITLSGAIGDALQAWTARVEADAPQLFQRDIWDDPEGSAQTSEARAAAEATSEEMRRALTAAVRAAHGAEGVYVWLRDYDAEARTLWFDRSREDSCQTWEQAYTVDDGAVALAGEATEVVARIVYDPVTAAGGTVVQQQAEAVVEATTPIATTSVTGGAPPTAPTHPPAIETETSVSGNQNTTGPAPGTGGAAEGQSAPVADAAAANARAQLAEERLASAQAQVAALTEAQTIAARETARAAAAEAEMQRMRADGVGRDTVARMMGEAGIPENMRVLIAPRVTDRIIGRVPVVAESGDVNTEGLEAAITAAITAEKAYAAALLEAQGAGQVRGLGATAAGEDVSDADLEAELGDIFGDIGMSEATAKAAAKGRIG